jgi:hypothetical protein
MTRTAFSFFSPASYLETPPPLAVAPTHAMLRPATLLYGGVALGLLAGAAISTWVWRQRVRASDLLSVTPLERAEQLIASCESKLESIESSFADLKSDHTDKP